MNVYVEFVGQHKAGKTTTLRHIVEESYFEKYNAIHPHLPEYSRSKWHFALWVPLLALRQVRHIVFLTWFFLCYAKMSKVNYRHVWFHLVKMIILHPYYERTFDFDLWFKDDMLHLLPRIVFKDKVDPKKAFAVYFKHFSYLYDGVVYLDIDWESLEKRLAARKKRDPDWDLESRMPIYEHAFEQQPAMRKMLEKQEEVPVLILDANEEVERNAQKVKDFVIEEVMKN